MLTVMTQARIPAPVSQSWDCLTQPSLIEKWFADADRFEPGKEFFLDFGRILPGDPRAAAQDGVARMRRERPEFLYSSQ